MSLLIASVFHRLFAQTSADSLRDVLVESGFENIRVVKENNEYFISFENNKYRWDVRALSTILDSVVTHAPENAELNIIQLKFNVPYIVTRVPAKAWLDYRRDSIDSEMDSLLHMSYRTTEAWEHLKKISPDKPGIFKYDIVLYPQFYLSNITFRKIYEIQLNIAPAVEVSFWKGMFLTAQVIFPIINDFGPQGDLIRPGFVVLSQNFRLPGTLFGRLSVGNFSNNRYGIDFSLKYPFKNERWEVSLTTGYTGSSYFTESYWHTKKLDTYTFTINASYYFRNANMLFNVGCGRYLQGDYGARMDVTRYFGESTLGFYAVITKNRPNGGFHFSFPIPPRKRWKRRTFRVIPPRYFDWEYNAGTSYKYGRYYETRPNENRSENFFNPVYIKSELLKIN